MPVANMLWKMRRKNKIAFKYPKACPTSGQAFGC